MHMDPCRCPGAGGVRASTSGCAAAVFFFVLTWAHKLQSFGLAGTATKRAKSG
ncbi:BQ2448_7751 [Microbotryum intermedium]|uniref:BQ2448_7751 protein n=1 Tax=Microbotryum intermedium TaxID=269621 RepID=A0A238FLR7_9BASI|nr:BQ2448_7751 [Microbotryum intermedium]